MRSGAIVSDLAYVSCPEFLKEGSAVADFMHPDRVVIGSDAGDEAAGDAVAAIYEPLGGEIVRTDVASAEMIKLASNAFLATKISFVNEIANVCEEVGADVGEVARGMGLDQRIGSSFLRAGIGYGGSCFDGGETLLVRRHGATKLVSFEELWELAGGDAEAVDGEAIEPQDLWAWSWVPGEEKPEWMPVSVLTKRDYDGEMVEIRTKMGRRVRVTADHPVVVGDGRDDQVVTTVHARDVTDADWLPLAGGAPDGFAPAAYSTVGAVEDSIPGEQTIVRPESREIETLRARPLGERLAILDHPRGQAQRMGDISRSGALRLHEACAAEMDLRGATLGTGRNGTYVPERLSIDEAFWRVVGLYVAEGHVARDSGRGESTRERITWSFHPTKEEHLVREVVDYWESQGVKATAFTTPTSRVVRVSSRVLAAWWTEILGLGRNSYEQRLPGMIWEQTATRKWSFLSGLWEGDGSWSLVKGGPSVTLDFGTISDEFADGTARLLGDLGILCSWRRGRTADVDQGDALAEDQRRRPGGTLVGSCSRVATIRGARRHRAAGEADRPQRAPPIRRLLDGLGPGDRNVEESLPGGPCIRWRLRFRTPLRRVAGSSFTSAFRRTSRRSRCWPGTPATTSSCSTR